MFDTAPTKAAGIAQKITSAIVIHHEITILIRRSYGFIFKFDQIISFGPTSEYFSVIL